MNSAGDRVIVGVPGDEDDGVIASGYSSIFISSSGGWIEEDSFSTAFITSPGDGEGQSVSMNGAGDFVIVGSTSNNGRVYTYSSSSASGWIERQKITASSPGFFQQNDAFGSSISMNFSGKVS